MDHEDLIPHRDKREDRSLIEDSDTTLIEDTDIEDWTRPPVLDVGVLDVGVTSTTDTHPRAAPDVRSLTGFAAIVPSILASSLWYKKIDIPVRSSGAAHPWGGSILYTM